MRKVIGAASSVALANAAMAGVPITKAPVARCGSEGEFVRVNKGMPKAKVARTFGADCHRHALAGSGGYVSDVRSHPLMPSIRGGCCAVHERSTDRQVRRLLIVCPEPRQEHVPHWSR